MKTSTKKANAKRNNVKVKKPRIKVVGDEMPDTPTAQEPTADAAGKTPAPKGKKAKTGNGKMSGLDAAAKVLDDAGIALNAKNIVELILAKGLWKTEGKTPAATLHAAISREIKLKGDTSRFRKGERGHFTTAR